MAGAPEGAAHLLRIRQVRAGEALFQPVHQPEGRCVRQRGARAALDQAVRPPPLPERPRIIQRRTATDHRTRGVDVRPGVQQRVEHLDVVAAGRPMQRRLLVRPGEPGVHLGTRRHQRGHRCRTARIVPRPVRDDVQQRPRHAAVVAAVVVTKPRGSQPRMLGQQPLQPRDIPGVDRLDRGNRPRILGIEDHHVGTAAHIAHPSPAHAPHGPGRRPGVWTAGHSRATT